MTTPKPDSALTLDENKKAEREKVALGSPLRSGLIVVLDRCCADERYGQLLSSRPVALGQFVRNYARSSQSITPSQFQSTSPS